MGIFSGLFKSRDKPQNRTSGSGYSFFFGGSTAGKNVNERSAMQMTAVYSCVRILAEAVAGLPLHLYRYKEDGGKEKALDHPLYNLLHDEPNPEMSSFVFRETLMTHLLLWGQRLRPDYPQRKGRGHRSLSADAQPHGGGQGHQGPALLPIHHQHRGRPHHEGGHRQPAALGCVAHPRLGL